MIPSNLIVSGRRVGANRRVVGVDPEPLVGAALAIEQRHSKAVRLELRGGIASGAVILLEGDDYVGRAVNLASRLCDIAAPGQLLAAIDNLDLREWAEATEYDPAVVKGMADEVAVVVLSTDRSVLRRKSRTRSANALLAVVEGITRPVRTWSQAN